MPPYLPSDFSIPELIVQRMPKMFTEALMHRLDRYCALYAEQAYDGAPLYSGMAFASVLAAVLLLPWRKGIHGLL